MKTKKKQQKPTIKHSHGGGFRGQGAHRKGAEKRMKSSFSIERTLRDEARDAARKDGYTFPDLICALLRGYLRFKEKHNKRDNTLDFFVFLESCIDNF